MIPIQRDLHPMVRQCLFETGNQVIGRRGHMRAGCMTTALTPYTASLYRFKGGGGFGGILKSVVLGAVLGAIGGGIGGALFGQAGTGILEGFSAWQAGAIVGAVSGGITGALGGIVAMMSPKKPEVEQEAYQQRENKVTVRSSTAPRKIILGTALAGGVMVYATSTGASKEYFHSVTTVASHQVSGLRECFFNNNPEGDSRFSGKYRINKHWGTQTQAADSDLVSEAGGEWTSSHRGRGVAYLYNRIQHDTNAWVTGLPTVSVMADGALVYDPRGAHVTLSVSGVGAPGIFSTVGSHGLAAGDIVFIRDHAGATYATPSGYAAAVAKAYTVNTVPSSTSFTLLNDGGEPMALLSPGSGGSVARCAWSNNWALGVLHYLLSRDGINCPTNRVDWSYWVASANVSDEDVSLGNSTSFTAAAASNVLTLGADVGWRTGVQVTASSTGTLPAPLAADTTYYWIKHDDSDAGIGQLAASYADAVSGNAIDIADVGSGTHTVFAAVSVTLSASADTVTLPDTTTYIETGDCVTLTGALAGTDYYWVNTGHKAGKLATSRANAIAGATVDIATDGTARLTRKSQARYTVNGILDLSKKPIDVLNDLLTAGSGVLVYASGKYRLFAGAPAASVKTLGEDGLRDSLRILPRAGRQQTVNAVRGTYKDPGKYWEMTDFPPLTKASYEAEDGGQRLYRDVSLPLTIDPQRAQRIASIALGRGRRSMTVNYPGTVDLLGISAWDAVQLALPTPGLATTKFRVNRWVLAENGQGIDLELIQEDDAIYTWTAGQGALLPKNDLSSLPDPWNPPAPVGLTLVEELYETRGSAGVKAKAALSWEDVGGSTIRYTVVRYRLEGSGDAGWVEMSPLKASSVEILDIAPGIYEWQARHYNTLGAASDWSATLRKEVFGLGAAPASMQGLTISAISSMALLRWTQSSDLDVRIGGKVEFRHSPALVGVTWSTSTSIGQALPGSDTVAVLPLKAGTYLARFVDSSGNPGPVSSVTSDGATVLAFSPVGSVTESPAFAGGNSGTVVIGSELQLAGSATVDGLADFDATPSLDVAGGIVTSGTYTFASGIDLVTVQRVRLVASIDATIVNVIDQMDDRTSNVDDWADFDGTNGANADAVVWVRHTQTDPAGSPVWSDWQRLDVGEFNARAFQFQCRLSTDDPAFNILVSTLSVTAEQL